MDWFVYDRDLRHERVKRVNPQNKTGCMREKLFPHTFLKQVTIQIIEVKKRFAYINGARD